VKSVRLAPNQERRLREAAARHGVTESEFIRRALEKACDEALGQESWHDRNKDLIGSLHLGGGIASRHHDLFGEAVETKYKRIKREAEERRSNKGA